MSDTASTATRPSLRDPRNWPMFAVMFAAFGVARLPWMLQRALGRGVGTVAYRLAGSRRRAAEVNLRLCFPEKDDAWRQRLLRDSFDALGVGIFEFARAWWGSGSGAILQRAGCKQEFSYGHARVCPGVVLTEQPAGWARPP